MKKSGSITVFTSLFLAVFLLVFQVLLQSVQIGGGRVQAETGVEEGLYSVFAGYDRDGVPATFHTARRGCTSVLQAVRAHRGLSDEDRRTGGSILGIAAKAVPFLWYISRRNPYERNTGISAAGLCRE